jgi:hypothetical protein
MIILEGSCAMPSRMVGGAVRCPGAVGLIVITAYMAAFPASEHVGEVLKGS